MKELEKARQQALSIFNNEWAEWKHVSMGLIRCPVCLALDKCWFQNVNGIKMPKLPQHEKCHCTTIRISAPIPGATALAELPIQKFTEYIFADKYAWNGKKALFESLGFDIMDAEWLKAEFEKQAQEKYSAGNYILGKLDAQGQRIDIEILINRDGKTAASFIAGWMVRKKGLITNNTPLGDK